MIPNSNRELRSGMMLTLLTRYQIRAYFDAMFEAPDRHVLIIAKLYEQLRSLSAKDLTQYQDHATRAFLDQGITFTVYGDVEQTGRIFPCDFLPYSFPTANAVT